MNKSDLVDRLAKELDLSKRQAGDSLETILRVIVAEVAGGEKVTIPGFGTFEPRARAARTARNPRTGEAVKVAATKVPAFKPGADFKAAVKGGKKKAAAKPKKR